MKDLREFIAKCSEIGELKTIDGADWNKEIGALIFEVASHQNPPALLFDNIKDYPSGFRILTIPCSTDKRLALTLGLPVDLERIELVRRLRDKLKEPLKLMPPVYVKDAPILENRQTGDSVDLYKFPSLQWTAIDGGRYIGTGDTVIVKDPDEGWVNVSTNRIQIHDKTTATIFCEPGQHLEIIREKYWKKGQACPVAVTCGGDPLLVSLGGTRVPWGMSEYDYAGWWRGEPVEVISGPTTGLPIPAYAEIVLEGEMISTDSKSIIEGPFAEFTGHYSPAGPEAIFKVKSVLHRNSPILLGVITFLGRGVPTWTRGPIMSANIWKHLDGIITGVTGVWSPDEFGLERCIVISVKQQYPGHAKQAALAALGYYPMSRKLVIIVDDDTDPSNIREVLFAVGNRAQMDTFEVIKGNWTSKLDPLLANPEIKRTHDATISTGIILATKPFHWIDQFPDLVDAAPELKKEIKSKWKNILDTI